jgi:hypothetical protein
MNYILLKELMKQSETECGFDPDKFAELIVRECMSKLYLNGYDDAMIQLQKDFGLGE